MPARCAHALRARLRPPGCSACGSLPATTWRTGSPRTAPGTRAAPVPGGRDGATSVYQRGRVTGRMVNGKPGAEHRRHGHEGDTGDGERGPATPRQPGARRWRWSRMTASMHRGSQEADRHEALLDHVLDERNVAKTHSGSHWPWPLAQREDRAQRRARSRRTTTAGRDGRPRAHRQQDGEKAPAEDTPPTRAAPPRTRPGPGRRCAGSGSRRTRSSRARSRRSPPRWARPARRDAPGPSSANHTGQASSTPPTTRPMAEGGCGMGRRPPQPSRSATKAAAAKARPGRDRDDGT